MTIDADLMRNDRQTEQMHLIVNHWYDSETRHVDAGGGDGDGDDAALGAAAAGDDDADGDEDGY